MFRQHLKPTGLIKSWTGVACNDAITFYCTKRPLAVPSVWGLILTSGDPDLTTVPPLYRVPRETRIISCSDLPMSSVHPVSFHTSIYSLLHTSRCEVFVHASMLVDSQNKQNTIRCLREHFTWCLSIYCIFVRKTCVVMSHLGCALFSNNSTAWSYTSIAQLLFMRTCNWFVSLTTYCK